MTTLNEIARDYGDLLLTSDGPALTRDQLRALRLLQLCGTGHTGLATWVCEDCRERHFTARTCGNRICPGCQPGRGAAWLAVNLNKALPVEYFMVTFTLPASLRWLAKKYPSQVYNAMFQASRKAMEEVLSRKKWGGLDRTGLTAVLHTWNRRMLFHPHIHCMLPGGGLTPTGDWKSTSADYLVHVKVLSGVYRDKLREELSQCGLLHLVPSHVWSGKFITNVERNGSGSNGLRYLSRYVSRTAISNHRIVGCVDGQVTYEWTPRGQTNPERTTLNAVKFLRRFLQHVLPAGFQSIRHYGLLHASSKESIESLREKILKAVPNEQTRSRLRALRRMIAELVSDEPSSPCCPTCHGRLQLVSITFRRDPLGRDDHLVFSKLVYQDTG